MSTDVEIRTSSIDGKGAFALKDFKKGETVLTWDTSHVIKDSDLELLSDSEKHFVARFAGRWILMQEPMRFVNHSCEANTFPKDGKDVAIRDIRRSEEITSDYRPEMKQAERMECHCNAKSCKGFIVGSAA